jgi:hypothetical protein
MEAVVESLALSESLSHVKIAKIDAETEQEYQFLFGISTFPAIFRCYLFYLYLFSL